MSGSGCNPIRKPLRLETALSHSKLFQSLHKLFAGSGVSMGLGASRPIVMLLCSYERPSIQKFPQAEDAYEAT